MHEAMAAPPPEASSGGRPRARMRARSPHEPHRTATALELFFDLVFVVAIAEAGGELHHAVAEAHVADGVIGIAILQVAWVGMLFVPHRWTLGFVTFATLELFLPMWAERAAPTTWHPHHIAERYGLFTLIVLGESILAAHMAIQSALASGEALRQLAPTILGGLLIGYSMWWVYFDRPVHGLLTGLRKATVWGYGHYFVFAAAAAVGAGLGVAVDRIAGHAAIGNRGAGFAVAVPVAVYLLSLWFLHDRPEYGKTRLYGPAVAALVLMTPLTGHAVPLTGVILAVMVGLKIVRQPSAAVSA